MCKIGGTTNIAKELPSNTSAKAAVRVRLAGQFFPVNIPYSHGQVMLKGRVWPLADSRVYNHRTPVQVAFTILINIPIFLKSIGKSSGMPFPVLHEVMSGFTCRYASGDQCARKLIC